METKEYRKNGISVIELIDDSVLLNETQDLLDIVSDYSIKSIILKRQNVSENFFDLSTGFAGEILQKASNYRIRLGIVGDFSSVASKSLRDFIYESNQTRKIVFKPTVEEILKIFFVRSV
jgi:hypothetical protein